MNWKNIFIIMLVFSTILGATGQLLFKIGLNNAGFNLIMFILLGVVSYGFSTVIYLYVLGRAHLSWTYGLGGLSYIFASLFAMIFINEPITLLRWIGILLIASGTVFIGIS
ncbi:MAG: hypothetical protein QXD23_01460 [Candidatus Micrarchaeaceae archaeon]